jgi:hypothetical protein
MMRQVLADRQPGYIRSENKTQGGAHREQLDSLVAN